MSSGYSIVICPHCKMSIEIIHSELNCRIYRHGVYKSNLKQIDPHLPKDMCDKLVKEKLIYGCGKPFKIFLNKKNIYEAIECAYI